MAFAWQIYVVQGNAQPGYTLRARTLWNAQPGYALRAAHLKIHFLIAAFAIPDHSGNSPACAGGHYVPPSAQCHSLFECDEHAKASVGKQFVHARVRLAS